MSCASPLLAPDIVERILDGRQTAGLARLLEPFPVEWERQCERLMKRLATDTPHRADNSPAAARSRDCRSLGLIEDMARELERIEPGSNGGCMQ